MSREQATVSGAKYRLATGKSSIASCIIIHFFSVFVKESLLSVHVVPVQSLQVQV